MGSSFCWVCCVCLWYHPVNCTLKNNKWQSSSWLKGLPFAWFLFMVSSCGVESWGSLQREIRLNTISLLKCFSHQKKSPPCRLPTWHQISCWLTTSRCPRLPLATFNSEPLTKSMIPSFPRATVNLMLHATQEVTNERTWESLDWLTLRTCAGVGLTCQGWCWHSWLCWPSWLV